MYNMQAVIRKSINNTTMQFERLGYIATNMANYNTAAYKTSRFEQFIREDGYVDGAIRTHALKGSIKITNNALDIAIARGGATVVAVAPSTAEVKYQAIEGAYQLGTLGFGTDTADMAALATEDFIAVEFGTVFFTAKMLGDQELQIGTTKAGGSATALTVSKKIGAGEILPAQFVAVLKDKITNEGDTVSDAYRNTTYVARSFVRYHDTTTNTYVVVYGNLKSGKLADLAQ